MMRKTGNTKKPIPNGGTNERPCFAFLDARPQLREWDNFVREMQDSSFELEDGVMPPPELPTREPPKLPGDENFGNDELQDDDLEQDFE